MGAESVKVKKYRRRAFERQAGLCYWCRQPMIWKTKQNAAKVWDHPRACTADHLVMRSHGGITVPENIVAACRECNNSRHWSSFEQVREGTATLADVWRKSVDGQSENK